MTRWVAHASIHSVRRLEPDDRTRLYRVLDAAPDTVVTAVPGGISVHLPVTADRFTEAYHKAVTVLATEILPDLEPAHLTDLHITALRPR